MEAGRPTPSTHRIAVWLSVLLGAAVVVLPRVSRAQSLAGPLVGTIRDQQGAVLAGAVATAASPALIGGPVTVTTNERGQLRFPVLPPGTYTLDVELSGFNPYHEANIQIGAGATLER